MYERLLHNRDVAMKAVIAFKDGDQLDWISLARARRTAGLSPIVHSLSGRAFPTSHQAVAWSVCEILHDIADWPIWDSGLLLRSLDVLGDRDPRLAAFDVETLIAEVHVESAYYGESAAPMAVSHEPVVATTKSGQRAKFCEQWKPPGGESYDGRKHAADRLKAYKEAHPDDSEVDASRLPERPVSVQKCVRPTVRRCVRLKNSRVFLPRVCLAHGKRGWLTLTVRPTVRPFRTHFLRGIYR